MYVLILQVHTFLREVKIGNFAPYIHHKWFKEEEDDVAMMRNKNTDVFVVLCRL